MFPTMSQTWGQSQEVAQSKAFDSQMGTCPSLPLAPPGSCFWEVDPTPGPHPTACAWFQRRLSGPLMHLCRWRMVIYGPVGKEKSFSNYQLPKFLALWPELEAAVWVTSPEDSAHFPGAEQMMETSVALCVSPVRQRISLAGSTGSQALAGPCFSLLGEDMRPFRGQTGSPPSGTSLSSLRALDWLPSALGSPAPLEFHSSGWRTCHLGQPPLSLQPALD